MPSLVRVDLELDSDAHLTADRLHAIVSGWLDGDDHWAQRKPYSVQPTHLRIGTHAAFLIGLVDDNLLVRLERALDRSDQELHIGPYAASIVGLDLIVAASWEQLADQAEADDLLAIEFISPTMFRRGDDHHLLPVPSTILGAWRSAWADHYGRSPEITLKDQPIHVRTLDVTTRTVRYRNQDWSGIVGHYHLDISGLQRHERAAIHAVASIAPFIGTGSYTASTFGATRIGPQRNSATADR